MDSAGFLLPLLNELDGVRALAPDLPRRGLSDPLDLPRYRYRELAVAWLDGLLDSVELDAAALVGHSGGGRWALWYAMAHPGRVKRLVLIGVPGLPKTRCPLPIRLIGTPGMGELLSRLVPPSRTAVLRFAGFMGEKATLATHPELVDLMVATGRDSIAASSARAEIRLGSPFALCRFLGSGVIHACDPTSCTSWPCPRWWYGANRTRSAAFRSPRQRPS